MNKDRYGINVKQFCREHEKEIERRIVAGEDPAAILEWHLLILSWLQHERLIHLLVVIMSVMVEIFALFLTFFLPEGNAYACLFMLAFLILVICYFAHYFFLENMTQHWYRIACELKGRCEAASAGRAAEAADGDVAAAGAPKEESEV
jgi:hypothetical protein